MSRLFRQNSYFPFSIQVNRAAWQSMGLGEVASAIRDKGLPTVMFYRELAMRISGRPGRRGLPVQAGMLNLYALLTRAFRLVCDRYFQEQEPGVLQKVLEGAGFGITADPYCRAAVRFCDLYPPAEIIAGEFPDGNKWLESDDPAATLRQIVAREMLLLHEDAGMPAMDVLRAGSWGAREWLGFPGLVDGGLADLVVYDEDPREDLRTLLAPRHVILRGRVIR